MVRKFCALDAEGSRVKLQGVAFYSNYHQEYLTDHDQIRDGLALYARTGYTFVAHNAQYDLPVIFWTLDIPMRAIYYDDKFNRGQWKYDPKKPYCELWDSYNLSGNIPLVELGKALGLPKYKTPQRLQGKDPDRYEWFCEKHDVGECEECYALRDAEIVYRYLETLTSVVGGWGAPVRARIAGISQSVWRVLDRPEPVSLKDGRVKYLAREAYFGGRTECFKLGHIAPLYTADIQSAYASVMLEGRFPDPASMVYFRNISPNDVPWDMEGCVEALVSVPVSSVPPLPNSHKGQRVFATGAQRGHWTLAELRYAQITGCRVLRVYRACWGTSSLQPFQNFISVLWELRQEYKRTGDPREQTVKALMNNAYGRLGLRGSIKQEVVEPWNPDMSMQDYVNMAKRKQGKPRRRADGTLPPEPVVIPELVRGKPYVRFGTPVQYDQPWVNILWAAQIAALARVKLHQFCLLQGTSLVYCDTDSVFSSMPIQGLGEGLGALSDHTTYSGGWIVGPKLYALEYHDGHHDARAKGVPRHKALAFLHGEEVVFDSPISPRSQRHGGPAAGEWIEIHRGRQLVPHRRTPLNPELLDSDYGWSSTLPPHMGP